MSLAGASRPDPNVDPWELALEAARSLNAPWLLEAEPTDVDPYERMLEGDRAEER